MWRFLDRMECPNCHAKVPDDAPSADVRKVFYPRRAGVDFWVCMECNRGFHSATGTRVS